MARTAPGVADDAAVTGGVVDDEAGESDRGGGFGGVDIEERAQRRAVE